MNYNLKKLSPFVVRLGKADRRLAWTVLPFKAFFSTPLRSFWFLHPTAAFTTGGASSYSNDQPVPSPQLQSGSSQPTNLAPQSDTFKLNEFSLKYLGGRKVEFTGTLEFVDSATIGGLHPAIPIYRVIDSEGRFVRDGLSPLSKEMSVQMYGTMVRLNVIDRILYEAQRQGRLSFYMTSFGEEASHVGSAAALQPQDLIWAQYRETGVLLWRGFTIEQCINQCYGNKLDPGKGKQMPVHYGSAEHNFVTISSPLATQIPQAVGSAYSFKLSNPTKADQERRIACVYFGEGAFSEGDAHAGLNFAATLQCPVIFFCRNNGYAISTPTSEQYAGDGIASKAVGYGMATIRVDGNDPIAVYNATSAARQIALSENRPVLIEAMTYRVGHHSTSDDSSAYRSSTEVDNWSSLDSPPSRFRAHIESMNWWSPADDKHLRDETRAHVLEAFVRLESVKKLPPDELFNDVYEKLPKHLLAQRSLLRAHLTEYGKHYPSLNEFEPIFSFPDNENSVDHN